MCDFLNRANLRHFSVLTFTLLLSLLSPKVEAQKMTENEFNVVLDSLQAELFEFNYWDSLNNVPLFFSFPFEVQKIAKRAENAGFEAAYYKAQYIRAKYYSYNDVIPRVFDIYDSAIQRAVQTESFESQARFIFYKGEENNRNDWYHTALELYNEAYLMADSLHFEQLKGQLVHAMARTYAQMRQDENAINYYQKAYAMALENEDNDLIMRSMGSIGIAYGRRGDADSALYYGQKSYEMALERDNISGIRKSLNVLIIGSQLLGNHNKVISLTREMNDLIEETGEVGYMITPLLSRSKSYAAEGDLVQALKDVDESLTYARQSGYQNGELNAMKWKIELLKSMGRYDSALSISAELHVIKDSLYHIETEERLASMTQNFEIRERQNRIETLVQVNEINSRRLLFRNLAIVALVMVFLVLVILLLLINRRKLEKEKYALQETQDKLLRSQLNPHFLFNALSSIQLFLINKGEGKEALEYLSKFAKLMRRILENSRESMVSLEDEVATLRHYLDLQKIRFDNKFEYRISLDTEKDAADIMIPPMFAQPFIENSLEHGISHRDDGVIQIWFKETKEGLSFRVEDNGIGISRSTRTNKEESHKSLATIITRDRINILRRQLKKTISFDIRDKMNDQEEITGTEVIFELPVVYR